MYGAAGQAETIRALHGVSFEVKRSEAVDIIERTGGTKS
jgi:ABC-type polysaccharide/polyol phosphate transport system ATPase subunit